MTAALHFIRDWLPFGQRRVAGIDGQELRHWLDRLSDASPDEIASALAKTIPRLIRGESKLQMRSMLLDALQAESANLLPTLENGVSLSQLPLSAAAHKMALAADNLLKVTAEGYASVVLCIAEHKLAAEHSTLLQHATLNGVRTLARRQLLAYRAYAPASESSWQNLHRLYRIARKYGFADQGEEQERISTHYLAALLLAFADPTKFPRQDIDLLAHLCRYFAPHLRVSDPRQEGDIPKDSAQFVVRADDIRPGRISVRVDASYLHDELIIDCSKVVAMLQQEISSPATGSRMTGSVSPLAAASALLPNLLNMWQGLSSRRYSRQNFRKRVDVVSGIDELWRFLSGPAFQRRQEDRQEYERGGPISEWAVIDESPDGFGIRFIRGELPPIEVGEVIGLRSRERSKVHVCLVRRVTNLGATRLELGLQELSAKAIPISLPDLPSTGGRAIFLPSMPGYDGIGGIIAGPGSLRRNAILVPPIDGSSSGMQLGRTIERNRQCEIACLIPTAESGNATFQNERISH